MKESRIPHITSQKVCHNLSLSFSHRVLQTEGFRMSESWLLILLIICACFQAWYLTFAASYQKSILKIKAIAK
jgi:hypothetical protein